MRTSALLACCLLVALLVAAPAAAGSPSTAAGSPADTLQGQTATQSGVVTNETGPETIEFRIQADGDARIVLSKTFPAKTGPERTAFRQVTNDFESGQYDLGYGAYPTIVERVSTETDRQMTIVDANARTYRADGVGHLEYQFTWTNFADATEQNVTIGPGFSTENGTWLDRLRPGQQLVISAPSGYAITESPAGPEFDDDSLIWVGEQTFRPGDLSVTFEESSGGGSFPTTTLALVSLLIVLLAITGWRLSARREDGTVGDRIDAIISAVDADGEAEEPETRTGEDDDPGEYSPEEPAGATGGTEVSASEPAGAAGTVDPELLSDEERVEQLLDSNGGRMKQATIVTETGWSNAKVSQLLSQMDEDDYVDKLRIGRENLITLPHVDVTDQE